LAGLQNNYRYAEFHGVPRFKPEVVSSRGLGEGGARHGMVAEQQQG
jgi:hypothetical protein